MATDPDPDQLAQRSKETPAQVSTLKAEIIATATQSITTLERTAEVFEQAAALAQYDAERRAASGRDGAEEERQTAARASEAAQRARYQAHQWRRYLRERV